MNIIGKLIRAGTMQVSGEEITGIVIEIPKDVLRALPFIPLYSEVAVQTIEETQKPQ